MAQTVPPSVRQWKEYTIVIAMGTLSVLKTIEIPQQCASTVLRSTMAQIVPPSVRPKRVCTIVIAMGTLSVLMQI